MDNLAEFLSSSYQRIGEMIEMEESILLSRKVLDVIEPDDPETLIHGRRQQIISFHAG